MIRLLALCACAVLLGACQTTGTSSIEGGESRVFERPPWIVLGKTEYDQRWIDSQIEGGVAAFKWERPGPRPAYIDAPVRKAKVAPVKKKRFRDRLHIPWPKARPVVIEPAPEPAPVVVAEPPPPPPPPPPPRSKLDELLHPSKS